MVFGQIAGFISELVHAVPASARASLIGTVRAKAMAAAGA
jgi:hypothetical protein